MNRKIFDLDLCWKEMQKGNVDALEKAYKTAFKPLIHYATEIMQQPQLAEEVVQDVFLKIWQNRSELSIKGSFKAYLFQSVHNHALNTLRQQKSRKESVNLLCSERTWQFISDTYDLNDTMVEKIFSDETEAVVDQIISKLPEKCRKVFVMSRFEFLKNEEIAALLGISENTVKTHIYNALQKIADGLKK